MQKITLIIFLFFFTGQVFCQKKSLGYWKGIIDREGSIMNIAVEFKIQAHKAVGFFNSPSQKASGIPLDSLIVANDSIQFQLMSDPITYFKCKVSKDKINGELIHRLWKNSPLSIHQCSQINLEAIVAL